jgi:hypothetical protein
MRSLISFLDCGNIYNNKEVWVFKVTKFEDIENKIIPFFMKYPIKEVKYKDFDYFCKAAKMIKEKKNI